MRTLSMTEIENGIREWSTIYQDEKYFGDEGAAENALMHLKHMRKLKFESEI